MAEIVRRKILYDGDVPHHVGDADINDYVGKEVFFVDCDFTPETKDIVLANKLYWQFVNCNIKKEKCITNNNLEWRM